ncbi:MAG: DUF1517 domain-containing protein [Myxococcota bacterium]|nr:DUF1517 domain-containing protein [Myxococcota bacterium]
MLVLVVGLLVALQAARRRYGTMGPLSASGRAWAGIDVSGIMLAIDWRARPFVQAALDRMARSGQTGSRRGLVALLGQTVDLLLRAEPAWLYAAVYNQHPTSPQLAEAAFRQKAADARSRFRHELVRNAEGRTQSAEGPRMRAREEEGEGLVVVTLVVAARGVLLDVHDAADASQIRTALAALRALDEQRLVALEVVWSPAAEQDRMSSAELEALYPELARLRGVQQVVGRVFCRYCSGPFAAELGRCPHCGAPLAQGGPASS